MLAQSARKFRAKFGSAKTPEKCTPMRRGLFDVPDGALAAAALFNRHRTDATTDVVDATSGPLSHSILGPRMYP